MYPRFREHWWQRRTTRDLYFGTRSDRSVTDFRAIKLNEEKSASDYSEFSSEFCPSLDKIPGTDTQE